MTTSAMVRETSSPAPKSRPVRLHAHEVRAILDERMTQMRRIVKFPPWAIGHEHKLRPTGMAQFVDGAAVRVLTCPHGQPGDQLWVKETLRGVIDTKLPEESPGPIASYAADGAHIWTGGGRAGWVWKRKMLPSIHMPRWASRITLEVTRVRVERLQDISEEDAKAEGVEPMTTLSPEQRIPRMFGDNTAIHRDVPFRWAFCHLWTSIHGEESWDANPFVWVVEFKRSTP